MILSQKLFSFYFSIFFILIISLNSFEIVNALEDKKQTENAKDMGGIKKEKDESNNINNNMKMQSPPQFPDLPPYLEKVLPSDVIQKLKAIHIDPTLSFLQKQEKIDKIMTSLPEEILDKIPPPPGFERLPENVRNKLKSIHRNKEKSWAQKQQELQSYIQSLPYEQRSFLMMGPQQVQQQNKGI
ncbi:hypothetical protein Mgra_00000289 [Meloidogyne graminicola]|uniref:Uncharacterized protein n=1 Tax=Meloidogyne graminicola TaxID=189291 RepID=A0A8T0A4Z8_9BILA|nr:hypothetical protein Mgra_00000289 [Meloidogyne graminicola]